MSLIDYIPGVISQFYIRIDVLAKSFIDGSSKTFSFVNRTPVSQKDFSHYEYRDLIVSYSGLGFKVDANVPSSVRGNVILDNTRGTFGFDRRISDALAKYSFIKSKVNVYLKMLNQGEDLASEGEFLTGEISGLVINTDTLELQIKNSPSLITIVNQSIMPTDFPDVDQDAWGRTLPLVFGADREIAAFFLETDSIAADNKFAYATCFNDLDDSGTGLQVKNGGISQVSFRGRETDRITVISPNDYKIFDGSDYGSERTQLLLAGIDTISQKIFQPFFTPAGSPPFAVDPADQEYSNVILYEARATYGGLSDSGFSVDSNSNFVFELWSQGSGGYPDRLIEQVLVPKSDYLTKIKGSSDFDVLFSFREGIPTDSSNRLLMQVYETIEPTKNGGNSDYVGHYVAIGTATFWDAPYGFARYVSGDGLGGPQWGVSGVTASFIKLYGMKLDQEHEFFDNGLGISSLLITSDSTSDSRPDVSALSPILLCDGLQDNDQGTISGSANTLLSNPLYIADLLTRDWSGGVWEQNKFSQAKYSGSHTGTDLAISASYPRAIAGIVKGRNTQERVLDNLFDDVGCLLIAAAGISNNLGLWAWGEEGLIAYRFTENDFQISSPPQIQGTESIVNRVQLFYDERVLTQRIEYIISQGEFSTFANVATSEADEELRDAVALSQSIFGVREIANSAFPFIADSTSANSMKEYLLRRFNRPWIVLSGFIPYHKYFGSNAASDYGGIALSPMSVVEISHTALPNLEGTSPDPGFPAVGDGATSDERAIECIQGNYLRRAKTYRALISGIEISGNRHETPTAEISLVLLIQPEDPT